MCAQMTTDYFDKLAPEWDERYKKSRLFRVRYQVFLNAVREHGQGCRRALDYGCGSGVLTTILQRLCESVVATDISEKMLEVTSAKFKKHENVAVTGIDKLGTAEFDLAICSSVIDYVNDPEDFISKLVGHLRPGGVLMITFSNKFGPLQILFRYLLRWFKRGMHTRLQGDLYTRRRILDLIGSQPVEVVQLDTRIGLPCFTELGLGELYFLVAKKKS